MDQLGEETPPAECPPVECGQSDGATGALHRKEGLTECTGRWHWNLLDAGRARLVRLTHGDIGAGV